MVSTHSAVMDRGSIRSQLTSFVAHWRPRIDEWKDTGKEVLEARAQHPERSLAEH